jgi:DNA invertase Pin-like site-specific DNA recombinase
VSKLKGGYDMIYGYARVSSKSQQDNNSFEQQERAIKDRWEDAIIVREQFTGTTTHRPILDGLIAKLKPNDTLVVTKLDRLARTTVEGIELVQSLFNMGVYVHVMNVGLLENTDMGKFFLTTLLAVAELERNQIVERTQSGKAIAKQNPNFMEGRPKKYSKEQINHAISLLNEHSYKQVEQMTGISKSTLIRANRMGI